MFRIEYGSISPLILCYVFSNFLRLILFLCSVCLQLYFFSTHCCSGSAKFYLCVGEKFLNSVLLLLVLVWFKRKLDCFIDVLCLTCRQTHTYSHSIQFIMSYCNSRCCSGCMRARPCTAYFIYSMIKYFSHAIIFLFLPFFGTETLHFMQFFSCTSVFLEKFPVSNLINLIRQQLSHWKISLFEFNNAIKRTYRHFEPTFQYTGPVYQKEKPHERKSVSN